MAIDSSFRGSKIAADVIGQSVFDRERPNFQEYIEVFAHDIVMQAVAGLRQLTYPVTPTREEELYAPLQEVEAGEVRKMLGTTHEALNRYLGGRSIVEPNKRLLPNGFILPLSAVIAEYPPDEYISANELADLYDSHPRQIERTLRTTSVGKTAIRFQRDNGKVSYNMWYEATANDYLDAHDPLKRGPKYGLYIQELTDLTGCSRTYIQDLAREMDTPMIELSTADGREVGAYKAPEVSEILQAVARIPFANKQDMSIGALQDVVTRAFFDTYLTRNAATVIPTRKRRHYSHDKNGIVHHVSAKQAEEIKAAFKRPSSGIDDSQYMSFSEIAEAAGVSPAVVSNQLTNEERRLAVPLHNVREVKPNGHAKALPASDAMKLVERLYVAPLPFHLVPFSYIARRSGFKRDDIEEYLSELNLSSERLVIEKARGFRGKDIACFPWATLQKLEEYYEPQGEDAFPISYEDLPTEADDADAARQLYARIIHAVYTPASAKNDTIDMSLAGQVLGLSKKSLKANAEDLGYRLYDNNSRVPLKALAEILPGVAWLQSPF